MMIAPVAAVIVANNAATRRYGYGRVAAGKANMVGGAGTDPDNIGWSIVFGLLAGFAIVAVIFVAAALTK
jgi:hypothetical protein